MKQEKRISYRAGITRRPSDFLCGEGELAECINLTTDSEELKPIVQPEVYMEGIDGDIVHIHRFNGETRFIYLRYRALARQQFAYELYWKTKDSNATQFWAYGFSGNKPGFHITSIGKTLIFTCGEEMHYYMWKPGTYNNMGEIPEPEFKCWLKIGYNGTMRDYVCNKGKCNPLISRTGDYPDYVYKVEDGQQEAWNELIIGLYTKNKKQIAQKKAFCLPFFVRVALELYDGTYTHISNPILLFPCVTSNSTVLEGDWEVSMVTQFLNLYISQTKDLTEWSDIVKDIVIFVSAGIEVYDLLVDQQTKSGTYVQGGADDRTYYDVISLLGDSTYYVKEKIGDKNGYPRSWRSKHERTGPEDEYGNVNPFVYKPYEELDNAIKGTNIFYKLCSIGLKTVSNKNAADYFDTHTLENLTSQSRLKEDDYFSRCPISARNIFAYNSRLNLLGVKRGFFDGFKFFSPYMTGGNHLTVYIETDSGIKVVDTTEDTYGGALLYFFYPDPRAKVVTIGNKNYELTEHPALNGAYHFAGIEKIISGSFTNDNATVPTTYDTTPEILDNYIVTSDANNPFTFKALGYNRVSFGEILAVAHLTMAVSQDAFGRTDLLVFTDNGIWGMAVDKTGLFESIHPFTRDVCINPRNIIETDGAVFFVSKRGLMVVTENGVKCVSEQMNGANFDTADMAGLTPSQLNDSSQPTGPWSGIIKACQGKTTFLEFIRNDNCAIAYDYIDSRLIICNSEYDYSYIYSMTDGAISKAVLPAKMSNAANFYPDYLLQSGTTVYSLYKKKREEEVTERQKAFLLTRPMKLAGPLTVSSLRELVNVGMWQKKDTSGNNLSTVKTEIWYSDDLYKWYPALSRFGAAAKYCRIALYINMLPTERLSGTIITEQERRDNNKRA